ncbi:hypothetical protein CYMTET_25993 [Cymbomonas tetramitiformis]|uniref:Uncharacterized protein n=1 Tax=Cymbomonas tetramitiformis TaxID=36881 RepID=A0AAE0FU99_9CHLO|nr:hypothetical protein CYMTET_25993 [Cymbomonas tetramitiformis]
MNFYRTPASRVIHGTMLKCMLSIITIFLSLHFIGLHKPCSKNPQPVTPSNSSDMADHREPIGREGLDEYPRRLKMLRSFGDNMCHFKVTGDVYQFGVFEGTTLKQIKGTFPSNFIWGFDSFQGLPEETKSVPRLQHWSSGQYNATFKGVTMEGLTRSFGGPDEVQFVKGFYNESLNADTVESFLPRRMAPALYVDIDCDLYISTVHSLDWMFREGLIQVGTLIGYDDWWVVPCASHRRQDKIGKYVSPRAEQVMGRPAVDVYAHGGEAQAHREMSVKYNVRFRCVCGPCASNMVHTHTDWRPYFVVEAMGPGVTPDHGFTMTADDVVKWTSSNRNCIFHYRRSFDYVSTEE